MAVYILRRFVNLIPTFILATLLAWFIVEIAPGDFASQFSFDQVDPNKAERIREVLGLNQHWYIRYYFWLANFAGFDLDLGNLSIDFSSVEFNASLAGIFSFIAGVFIILGEFVWYTIIVWFNFIIQFFQTLFSGNLRPFDLGTSLISKGNVTSLIVPRMSNSFVLLLPATVLIYLVAIPIGVYSALRKYSIGDRVLTVFSLIGLAIPNFFLALIFLAFSVQWFQANGWFLLPTGGMTSNNYSDLTAWGKLIDILWHLIVPMIVVVTSSLAGLTRFMRGEMLEVLGQDYIRTAKAKGLSERSINYKHGLRNAIIIIIATIGGVLPGLISGAGTVEFVTGWPGITPLFIRAIFAQDVYIIMAVLTILTILLMIGNLISDLLLAVIDPRIRY